RSRRKPLPGGASGGHRAAAAAWRPRPADRGAQIEERQGVVAGVHPRRPGAEQLLVEPRRRRLVRLDAEAGAGRDPAEVDVARRRSAGAAAEGEQRPDGVRADPGEAAEPRLVLGPALGREPLRGEVEGAGPARVAEAVPGA